MAVAKNSARQLRHIELCRNGFILRNSGWLPLGAKRLNLARDIAIAAREYLSGTEAEQRLFVEDSGTDPEELNHVPALFVVDSLKCHGWRAEFLRWDVGR